jgi:hypothetical protein
MFLHEGFPKMTKWFGEPRILLLTVKQETKKEKK